MFGRRFFGARFFAPRYFGGVGADAVAPQQPVDGGVVLPWWLNPYIRKQLDEREAERKAPRVIDAWIEFPLPRVRAKLEVVPVRGGYAVMPMPEVSGTIERGVSGVAEATFPLPIVEIEANVGAVARVISADIRPQAKALVYLPVEGAVQASIRIEAVARATHYIALRGRGDMPLPIVSIRAEVARQATIVAQIPTPIASAQATVGTVSTIRAEIVPFASGQVYHDPDDEETLAALLLAA